VRPGRGVGLDLSPSTTLSNSYDCVVQDRPALFLLIGFSGTGKLTVAKALRSLLMDRGRTVRLVDNHYVNNPIFGLVENDGVRQLPAGTWDMVGEVRDAIVRTVETLSPRDWSFIFTNDLTDSLMERAWVERLLAVAEGRGSLFVPVRLLCEVEELCRRIASPERRVLMKSTDPDWIRLRAETQQVLDPGLPSTLTLDITSMQPDEAAGRILSHVEGL
jgi:hypothetical protein